MVPFMSLVTPKPPALLGIGVIFLVVDMVGDGFSEESLILNILQVTRGSGVCPCGTIP